MNKNLPKSHARKSKLARSGFSIIELTIVVLVIAIVATVSIPMMQGNLLLYRHQSAVGFISSGMIEARMAAMKTNRPARLEINTTARSLTVWSTNVKGEAIRLGVPVYYSRDVSIAGASPISITFNSLGRRQTGSVSTVTLTQARTNSCKRVDLSPVGKISVAKCGS